MPAAAELSPPATPPTAAAKQPENAVPLQAATAGPKKKKSKSTAARGPTAMPKSRGTGFEEYYAEPPLTPEEHEEELELYDPALPFDERIETCLQRYRARRRLDNERSLLLNRYLSLGGIDCQPRQFNGTADLQRGKADNDLSRSDARTLSSTDIVPRGGAKDSKYYTADHASLWTVDFTGVVSGYLSQSLPALAADSEKRLTIGIDVVDNFLRYLQIHDVCLEHADDIKEARAVCSRAYTELPDCYDARLLLPGRFNLACVRLFYTEPAHTALNDGLDPRDNKLTPDVATAKEIYAKAMADKGFGRLRYDDAHIVSTKEADLEIIHLGVPTPPASAQSEASDDDDNADSTNKNKPEDSKPVQQQFDVVKARHYTIEEGYANQPHPSAKELRARGEVSFFVDRELIKLLRIGTKMRIVYHRLNTGTTFVSTIKDVLPSFYVFLPQELMADWREPRENEREAPSVANPDADADEEAAQSAAD